jgi:GntR family transcriptional regulator/MocR family aminotransferase
MKSWSFPVSLEETSELPVYLQIAEAIAADVRRGRLRAGDSLPGSRTLASEIGVHRNTVVAAYRELTAQGWVSARPKGATSIAETMPETSKRRAERREPRPIPSRLAFDISTRAGEPPTPKIKRGAIVLAGGTPDVRLAPTATLARAYRRAMRLQGSALLGYVTDARGNPRLRAAIAEMLASARGLAAREDTVIITRGSQMALDLLARTLVAPGDAVAVEAIGYRPAWGALLRAGAKLVPVPVDERGVDVDHLERTLQTTSIRAIYVTPHHQYPTTTTLAPARRAKLLDLASAHRFAVIEDDYDFEFQYEGRPVLPLASSDTRGVVAYVGTLSKVLAPGLRLGYVAGPAPLLEALARERFYVDRQGDLVTEAAIAELLEDGELQRHVRRMRRVYHARRDVFVAALRRELGTAISLRVPAGGMALWVAVDPSIDVDVWVDRAAEQGAVFLGARNFVFAGEPPPNARLGFAACTEGELEEGARRLAKALPSRKRRSA